MTQRRRLALKPWFVRFLANPTTYSISEEKQNELFVRQQSKSAKAGLLRAAPKSAHPDPGTKPDFSDSGYNHRQHLLTGQASRPTH
jgi:hypothetical protein